ncbi:polyhydroxyalkanoic acid system family protein [Oleiagrimonas sp. C23AA]|uniref:polyhydroxyalkanoic acid system family protein n=1 Tax=Oleiagrimonas sp. C23AA TaxID=2719047 RepID=UPI001420BE69|nr:polyhydroxyalkanoic acid system family protein [Oleiagrimonas sp. C23AA]NII10366.1 polyhydroxyalkanoic acid synthase [Oleiagrimonas sp. C23AA]
MPSIDISRSHSLGKEGARDVVEKVAARMQAKFDVSTHWEGDTLKFQRSGVDGAISVEPTHVNVSAKLGMLLSPLKPMIEQEIARKLDEYLA